MMSYPRNLELEILENLDNPRALFILGSRRVGKTTLLQIGRASCRERV